MVVGFTPPVKIGPGFEGDLLIENNGSATLYLVDMVMMGEDLWNQPSVQFMAAFCCLGPVFALIGIIGMIRELNDLSPNQRFWYLDQEEFPLQRSSITR